MQRHSIDQYGGRLLLANSIVINDNDYESQIKERKKNSGKETFKLSTTKSYRQDIRGTKKR